MTKELKNRLFFAADFFIHLHWFVDMTEIDQAIWTVVFFMKMFTEIVGVLMFVIIGDLLLLVHFSSLAVPCNFSNELVEANLPEAYTYISSTTF